MRYLENWLEEKQSAYLYHALATIEAGTPREKMFRELAKHADSQAEHWRGVASKAGEKIPDTYAPGTLIRFVHLLMHRLGPRRILPMLAAVKVRGLSAYSVAEPDRSPASTLVTKIDGHETPTTLSDVGKRHQLKGGGGNLRAAVFGINDGLVSNAGLILGVAAAASFDTRVILLSGTAGLLAGALSMASGEYVSVRSQRELLEYQLSLERAELEQYPEEEAKELALIYEARGLPLEEAEALAKKLVANPEHALHTLAREELALDPDDLGSPWGAAQSSFIAFSLGALIPLLPFLVSRNVTMVWVSIFLTAVALFATGALVSLFSGRRVLSSGIRMLAIGGGAGLVSYLIGTLLS